MTTETAIEQIKALPGVTNARLWNSVPGKERIYIDTVKCNGGKAWNGGKGYADCYIQIATRQVVMTGEAGAATRQRHNELGTHAALVRIASELN